MKDIEIADDLMQTHLDIENKRKDEIDTITNEDGKINESDAYDVDFTPSMKYMLSMERLVKGQNAYCCPKHKSTNIDIISNCQQPNNLRVHVEKLYKKPFSELFIGLD